MAHRSLTRFTSRKALLVGALLVLATPGSAYANSVAVTVRTPGATAGPTAIDSSVSTDAQCGSGLVSGGGIDQAIGTGAGVNGNHVLSSEPSSDGTSEYTGTTGVVGTDVAYWIARGGSGGQVNSSFSTTPYAMCLTSTLIGHTQVVMNKANTPTTAATVGLATATCPSGTVLLGGGALVTPGNTGNFKVIGSFPTFADSAHDHGKIAAADGATNPDSWTAVGWDNSTNAANETYAYAICSGSGINVSGVTVTVRFGEVSGPNTGSTGQNATATCGSGDGKLVSGGAAISSGGVSTTDFTGPGSGGDHLNGSFPSDSSGNPVANGATTAASWTAFAHTGGMASTSNHTDVWALCANDGV
ncbi:hypothetical protein [Streptacidiphilus jiangxiensis]|uniref:Uncharacterized protein n=1 Tax=Streptacidiphilus jiangxiensis TaxID=235985 RepID=A0A1H7KQ91_STRJI|nr:hypothetical protein [Streptacidiphilus jiangxiensis]SEK88690.1 hypothetical protein SAMN05414137_104145 [Streptacidiphilus jiangxiensis]